MDTSGTMYDDINYSIMYSRWINSFYIGTIEPCIIIDAYVQTFDDTIPSRLELY